MKVSCDYDNIPVIEPKTFGCAWKAWWVSLQPSCRLSANEQWPLIHIKLDDVKEWDPLWCAGPCGIFLVVLSLAWWLWAVSENEEEAEDGVTLSDVQEAVSDVLWVLRLAVPSLLPAQPTIQKRLHPVEDEESSVPTKRVRSE